MSYPINQALTYTAVATTTGAPTDTFTYAWAFDDGGTGNTASLGYTWTTAGNHLATVTATDNTTGATASASKTISLGDWSAFSWTSTSIKIIPDASPSFGSTLGSQQTNLIVSGDLIVNVFDYYNPQILVVFNTSLLTKTEYTGLLGVVGDPTAAFLLDSGPNIGNILILGSATRRYGFFNPNTGAFTLSPNITPSAPARYGLRASPSSKMGNGNWFVHGTTSGGSLACMIYDPLADSWAVASGSGSSTQMDNLFTLPSGNLLAYKNVTTSTFLYNYSTNTWSIGPTLPTSLSGASPLSKLNDGRIICVTGDSAAKQATWTEGAGAFVVGTASYPFTSQNAAATSNLSQTLLVAPDGMVINIGGECSSTMTLGDTKTIFLVPDGAWVVGANLITSGISYKQCFASGRAWRSRSGILEYSSIW